MTPLAHKLAADSALPFAKRRHDSTAKALGIFDGLHFFEVSGIVASCCDLAEEVAKRGAPERAGFLPAPRCFLEWRNRNGRRQGVLLEGDLEDAAVRIQHVADCGDEGVHLIGPPGILNLRKAGWGAFKYEHDHDRCRSLLAAFGEDGDEVILAMLAMINTPRVIGRRIHQPHAGLQRKLAAAHSMPGKYPLQAWHELVLEVKPPRDEGDRGPQQTILSGGKARHFVRAYLRINAGSLQLVSSHWKGDPALGLKQTRYRIIPRRAA